MGSPTNRVKMAKLLVITFLCVALVASSLAAPNDLDVENQPSEVSLEPEEESSNLDLLEDRDDEDDDDDDDEDDEDDRELGEEDMRDASVSDEHRAGDAAEPADIEDEADEDEDLMDF